MEDILFDAARDSLGVYPQATKRGDAWEYRTEWQEGWNAAIFKLLEQYAAIQSWCATLSPFLLSALVELLKADAMALNVGSDTVQCYLIMNDVWGYATADAEEVPTEELPHVAALWRMYGWDGLIAWAARQSGQEPIKERLTEGYRKAVLSLHAVPATAVR